MADKWPADSFAPYTIEKADMFAYDDPIDGSVSKNQVSFPPAMPAVSLFHSDSLSFTDTHLYLRVVVSVAKAATGLCDSVRSSTDRCGRPLAGMAWRGGEC
eukprot:2491273-Rhodomonas_salina.2